MAMISEQNRLNIQVIRGMACIFICFNHCAFFNKYSLGEIGVEFFVIMSGFLTAMNAMDNGGLRKNYLISKVRKMIPLYWLATIAIYCLGSIKPQLFSSMDFGVSNLVYSLFLVPGHTFYLYQGWTLTYFFMFYIIYWCVDKMTKHRDCWASTIMIGIVLLGFVFEFVGWDNPLIQYTNPILLEFVYGICLYYLVVLASVKISKKSGIASGLIIALLFFNYNKYMGARWLVPSILTCVVIFFMFNSASDNRVKQFWARIGDMSFEIYILHPLVIRPVDKVMMKIFGITHPIYFVGVILGVMLTVIICGMIRTILKKFYLTE